MPETIAAQRPLTGYHLKLIALITMLIDHIGAVLFPQIALLRIIGRVSFPLYAFLAAEGCRYSRDRGRYALRLGIFALVSEIPYDLALHPEFLEYGLWGDNFFFQTNIFYTLFFAVFSIHAFEVLRRSARRAQLAALGGFAGVMVQGSVLNALANSGGGKWLLYAAHLIALSYLPALLWACRLLEKGPGGGKAGFLSNTLAAVPLLLALLFAGMYGSSYGPAAVVFIFLLYLAGTRRAQAGVVALWVLYYYGWSTWLGRSLIQHTAIPLSGALPRLCSALAAAALVYVAYNGRRGRKTRWVFYAAYPVHLLLLAALRMALGR